MNIDSAYSVFKIRRKYGSIEAAANHYGVNKALIYLITQGHRGQKAKGSRASEILENLIDDGLVVLKDSPAIN